MTVAGHRRIIIGVLIACAFIIIVVRYFQMPNDDPVLLKAFHDAHGTRVKMTGTVIDDPDIQNGNAKFTLKISSIHDSPITSGKHLVLVKSDLAAVRYGDEIEMQAALKKPEEIVNADGRAFDYASYLSKDHIFYIATARGKDARTGEQNISIKSRGHGNPIVALLYDFKRTFVEHINRILPSPHAFLGAGLIISGKGSLSKELQTDFQRVGLIHIVVLSGFNISVIGEAIMRIVSFLPQTLGAVCGGTGIILFSIMTGGGSTVVRSAIMSLIGLYARISGRVNSALTSLMIAGLLMLMWNPLLALYDPSFQLSFAATLGLILYAEPIERLLTSCAKRLRLSKDILSLVSSTTATQIFTMPLIMRLSGVVSLIALPVNILVLPLIPFTMFFVFAAGSVSFISVLAAAIPAFVSWMLLSYELGVVSHAAALPFAAVTLPPVSLEMVLLAYAMLLSIGSFLYIRRSGKDMKLLSEIKSTASG